MKRDFDDNWQMTHQLRLTKAFHVRLPVANLFSLGDSDFSVSNTGDLQMIPQ